MTYHIDRAQFGSTPPGSRPQPHQCQWKVSKSMWQTTSIQRRPAKNGTVLLGYDGGTAWVRRRPAKVGTTPLGYGAVPRRVE